MKNAMVSDKCFIVRGWIEDNHVLCMSSIQCDPHECSDYYKCRAYKITIEPIKEEEN